MSCNSYVDLPNHQQYRYLPGKVNRVLPLSVFHITQDEVKTAYLQGGSFSFKHMGLHYTRLAVKTLIEIYNEAYKQTFNHIGSLNETATARFENAFIGSERAASRDSISKWLEAKKKKLIALKKQLHNDDRFIEFHNNFTLYTLTLLNLPSTHRPHRDPYYSFASFIGHDMVQITEKEVNRGYEGRLAVLSDEAIGQVEQYKKYFSSLVGLCSANQLIDLSKRLKKVLNSTENPKNGLPAFFFINEERIENITERHLKQYYDDDCTGSHLAENFVRHSFSTFMAEQNAPRYLSAAQMGHVSKGNELFGPNSNISPLEFKDKLKPFLQDYMNELGIQVIKAPRYNELKTVIVKIVVA